MRQLPRVPPGTALRRACFVLGDERSSFERRSLACEPTVNAELQAIIGTFLSGYEAALESRDHAELARRLREGVDPAMLGFAHEGAGMFLALLDHLPPRKGNRVDAFRQAHARPHDDLVCVGVGFAVARLPWLRRDPVRCALRYPPGCAGLVLDGFGFHEAFFDSRRVIDAAARPRRLAGRAGRPFDAGVGRALWFLCGASAPRIGAAIAGFPPERRAGLWAGVGLAASYAGHVYSDLARYEQVLERLTIASRPHCADLEAGVALAAATRRKEGNPTVWSERSCETVLGICFAEAADAGTSAWERAVSDVMGQGGGDARLVVHELAAKHVAGWLEARGAARSSSSARRARPSRIIGGTA